jgi:thiosulfate dehydrogenase (quinone) large subunit
VVDVLFMAAMPALGVVLMLGIRDADRRCDWGVGDGPDVGWVLPPASNPLLDDHLVYAGVLALLGAGLRPGLGRIWTATPLVRRALWLA